jgi:hypothetical protein
MVGVLTWPAGVQQNPHATVGILLVRDGTALDALTDSIHRGAEMVGGLRDANTLGSGAGRVSC